jgi:hypothetical protein
MTDRICIDEQIMQKKKNEEVIVVKELTVTEQLELFADILIDIYLEKEQKTEIHEEK